MKIKVFRNQATVLASTSRFNVLSAGRRFGKTVLACIKLFLSAAKTKDGVFWYVSPTYRQSKQIAWKMLVRLIPEQVLAKKPNESELTFAFKNGAEICLKGADNPDSLRGSGLDGLVIDEFASIRNAKSVWEEVLRPALSDKVGWCLFIGTPKGKNAFFELFMKGERNEGGYRSFKFKTEDNPYIERSEIKEAERQLSASYFRQEYEASFEDYKGLIWPEFNDKEHLIEPFEIPEHWTRVGSIDPAITGITAFLCGAVDEKGKIYIYKAFREADKRVNEVAEAIRATDVPESNWLIDPAAKSLKTVQAGSVYNLWSEYRDHGVTPRAGQNDVGAGINRVAEYLKAGKLVFFDNLEPLIWELERYHWSDNEEGKHGFSKPQPFKADDHLCDALRYLVMDRSSPAMELEDKPPINSVAGWEAHAEAWKESQEAIDEELYG